VKYLDEYRDAGVAKGIAQAVRARVTRPWVLMEICGGQTHTIMRYGLDEMLPPEIELVHGPGCPVCVAPLEIIDKALAIAARPGVIFVSYGDMLRVPGSHSDLFRVKAAGGDVRIAYSPMDAVKLARENPSRQVVFFGIGFETTAPANAMSVWQAKRRAAEFLAAGGARACAAGHARHPGLSGQPRAGPHRAGARVHRDGLAPV